MSGWRSPFAKAVLGVLGLGVMALAFFGFRPDRVRVETAVAEHRALTEALREEGRLRVRQRHTIAAPLAGYIGRVELRPGDRVSAGQIVASISAGAGALLDPATAGRLQADLAAARANMSSARARVSGARAAAELAGAEWRRIEPLLARGALAAMDGDRARVAANRASDDYDAARFAHELAQAQVASIQAVLDRQGDRGEQPIDVTAPVAGVVLHRWRESQGPVQSGERLIDIGDPGSLELEVDLLSADAVRVSEGMVVRLHRWGGEPYLQARVRRVEPVAFTKVSALGVEEQRVWVWSDLTSPAEQLRVGDGYRVEAEFVLSEADALVVPDAALFRSEIGWAVFVVDEGVAKLRAVRVGRSSGIDTEIIDGLRPGESVIVHPDDRVEDGSRVDAA